MLHGQCPSQSKFCGCMLRLCMECQCGMTWTPLMFHWHMAGLSSRQYLNIWNPVHLVYGGTRLYVQVWASTYLRLYWQHGCTRTWNLKMVLTSMYWHRKFLGQYILVCTCMCWPVPLWYKVVQGGTRWYMPVTVQGTVYGGTWRYTAVQESVE